MPNKDDEADVELYVVVTPSVPETVFLDEAYLHRITMNLLSNAIKFTKAGYILLVLDVIENDLVITVKDTGHGKSQFLSITLKSGQCWPLSLICTKPGFVSGMPAEFVPVMFEPFKQAQSRAMSRGTGLGLSIIKQLVDKMHGTIDVESQSEKDVGVGNSGTTLTTTIPLPQSASSSDAEAPLMLAEEANIVALIERRDNLRASEGLRLAWEKFGFEVVVLPYAQHTEPGHSSTKWMYMMTDVSTLKSGPSRAPLLSRDACQSILVAYNEPRELQELPQMAANVTTLHKPLVWHKFNDQIASVRDGSTKDERKVRFAQPANNTVSQTVNGVSHAEAASKRYTILLAEDNPVRWPQTFQLQSLIAIDQSKTRREDAGHSGL